MRQFFHTVSTVLILSAISVILMGSLACSSTPSQSAPQPVTTAPQKPTEAGPANQQISATTTANKSGKETVIKLTAKKFEYSPSQITVKKGDSVVFELTSKDRVHGFNLPDFKLRSDIKPGQVTRVSFIPDKTGTFTFACDIYCGSGHEEMSGTLTVID